MARGAVEPHATNPQGISARTLALHNVTADLLALLIPAAAGPDSRLIIGDIVRIHVKRV